MEKLSDLNSNVCPSDKATAAVAPTLQKKLPDGLRGAVLNSRYLLEDYLGEGLTSRVLKCWDIEEKRFVALKILHQGAAFTKDGETEAQLLESLAKCFNSKSFIVEMLDSFVYQDRYCIVFEKLGPSFGKMMEMNKFKPLSIGLVRLLGRQLLECVYYIHSIGFLHTDLKPSNVLLVDRSLTFANFLLTRKREGYWEPRLVKLIDFTCASFPTPGYNDAISAPAYRSPEVILGLDWHLPSDIWSVGCIMLELCSGMCPVFRPDNALEHLAMMHKVLGEPVPKHMIESGKKVFAHWQEDVSKEMLSMPRLEDLVMQLQFDDLKSRDELLDLLQGLLRYDPDDRLTAEEALEHPFIRNGRVGRSLITPRDYRSAGKSVIVV